MAREFIYNIANTKNYGHILVNMNDWESDKVLTQINLRGNLLPTGITKVVKINSAPAYRPLPFEEGSIVAISNIGVRIGMMKPMNLPNDSNTYANVHLSQVLGYFKDNILSIDNFVPVYDKVVMKKIEVPADISLQLITDTMSVGEVISVGSGGFTEVWEKRPMQVKVGEHVLIRDNVTTTISIGGEEYYITDDSNIVGHFPNKAYNLEELEMYNKELSIFEEHDTENILGTILLKPVMSGDISIAETYQENMFKAVISDKFEKAGIYFISRFDTEYIKFKNKNYFIANNNKVMARKAKGDE